MRYLSILPLALVMVSGCKKDEDDTDTDVADTDATDTDTDAADTDTDAADTDDTDVADTDDTDAPDTDDTDAGDTLFTLTFDGSGYDPHDGQTVALAIHDTDGFALTGGGMATVAGGTFTITVADKLEDGKSYAIDWFADMNNNKKCDADDHAWHMEIGPVTADVAHSDTHDAAAIDMMACKAF